MTISERHVKQKGARPRWVGAFLALAVTLLLSLIPIKVPALNPFWQQDALQATMLQAEASGSLGAKMGPQLSESRSKVVVGSWNPLSVHSGDRPNTHVALQDPSPGLYAGIRASARIPAKRVRLAALPPPSSFNLRAPPARG